MCRLTCAIGVTPAGGLNFPQNCAFGDVHDQSSGEHHLLTGTPLFSELTSVQYDVIALPYVAESVRRACDGWRKHTDAGFNEKRSTK
jgi:hypothetical protein